MGASMKTFFRVVLWLVITALYVDGTSDLYRFYQAGRILPKDALPMAIIVFLSLGCLIYQWARLVQEARK